VHGVGDMIRASLVEGEAVCYLWDWAVREGGFQCIGAARESHLDGLFEVLFCLLVEGKKLSSSKVFGSVCVDLYNFLVDGS